MEPDRPIVNIESPNPEKFVMENSTMQSNIDILHKEIDETFAESIEKTILSLYDRRYFYISCSSSCDLSAEGWLSYDELSCNCSDLEGVWPGWSPGYLKKEKIGKKMSHQNEQESATAPDQRTENY